MLCEEELLFLIELLLLVELLPLEGAGSMCFSHSVVSDPLRPMDCNPQGVGFHSLLQGIFLTQGSNPGLLHCRQVLYHLSHQRSLGRFYGPSQIVN